MNIGYVAPLKRAWQRTQLILFRPFQLDKWLILGFTAWLATLGESTSETAHTVFDNDDDRSYSRYRDRDEFRDWASDTFESVREFFASGLEGAIVLMIIITFIVIALLVTWLSSRGHFLFLDNVVHNRAQLSDPWRRFGRLGDSLFIWRLVFGGISLLIFGALGALFLYSIFPWIGTDDLAGIGILNLILFIGAALTCGLAFSFIEMLLYHFVVPLMYKYQIGVLDAWRRFLVLLRRETIYFVLYAFFLLISYLVLGFSLIAIGLLTCCAGFLVMILFAIPILGSILALPFHVTWRGFGLEFLAQFGDEFRVLPRDESQVPIK